jgi:single-strand DNA-binding protein
VVCLERLRASKEKFMFDNVVRLIGFVGSDAELKTTKAQREYAVLSLATTASWKDKNGDGYIRRTEWHRL